MKKILFIIGGGVIIGLILFWYFIIGIKWQNEGAIYNKGKNAVWISHSFVGQQHSDEEIQQFVDKLKKHQIKYIFVHSGPFNKDGGVFPYRYKYGREFIKQGKAADPDNTLVWLAWLGQLRNKLPYADPKVREKIALTGQFFVYNLGFDGIHLDIEPINDGDQAFLLLLQEMRQKLDETKIISVASDEWQPKRITQLAAYFLKQKIVSFWTSAYYFEVSKYANQIAVMTYDSGLKNAKHFQWFVEQQVIYITNAVQPNTEVLIGIPAYSYPKKTKSFDSEVENVQTGLLGTIQGLNNIRSNKNTFAGVAIYPEWQIDEKEWEMYDEIWNKSK